MKAEMNLTELEQILENQLNRFDKWQKHQIWLVFERIKREQLWRKRKYNNFAHYCLDVWGYEKSHAYRLVAAGEAICSLKEGDLMGCLPFPDRLSVAIKLYRHPPAKRLLIWKAHLEGVPIPAVVQNPRKVLNRQDRLSFPNSTTQLDRF
jgi:hypothetical protein